MWSLIKGTLNVEDEEKHNLGPAIKVPNRRIGLIVVGHDIRNLQKLSSCFYSQAISVRYQSEWISVSAYPEESVS